MTTRTPPAASSGTAAEYLRRSIERDKRADRDEGALQRAENRAEAARDGRTIEQTYKGDWGVSGGRDKRVKRGAMADMIEAVRAGRVSVIYCYTTDRLARDVEYGMTLWNACKDAGTVIRCGRQTFNPGEPGHLMLWTMILANAEEDLDRMTRKNQDTQDFLADHASTCPLPGRPHRGRCYQIGCTDTSHCGYAHRRGREPYGTRPGEDVAAVVAALRDAPSATAAAKVLNAAGVPTRLGGLWESGTVLDIARRRDRRVPRAGTQGRAIHAPQRFSGLLRCWCGRTMTSMTSAWGPRYYCRDAHRQDEAHHPRPYVVAEAKILPWVKERVDGFREFVMPSPGMTATAKASVLAALSAQRLAVLDNYTTPGGYTRAERDARLARIRDDVERISASGESSALTLEAVRTVDWSADASTINAALSRLWQYVQLERVPLASTHRAPSGFDLAPARAVYWPTEDWTEAGPDVDWDAVAIAGRRLATVPPFPPPEQS